MKEVYNIKCNEIKRINEIRKSMRHLRLASLNSIYCLIEYSDRAVRLLLLCKVLLKKVAKPPY